MVSSVFPILQYYDTMDLLEKMGVNGKIFDMLVYLFLPFFFILYFLTPKLWKYFGQFAGRKIFFTLLILSFIIPVNQFSRVMYLKHFIKTYEKRRFLYARKRLRLGLPVD